MKPSGSESAIRNLNGTFVKGGTCGKFNPFYGRKHSPETIEKMKKAAHNRDLTEKWKSNLSKALKGRVLSEDHRAKISKAQKGKNHPFYGKHHSKETISKISKAATQSHLRGVYDDAGSNYDSGHFFSKKNGKSYHYRSSYELVVYELLEAMPMVMKYDVEPFSIKYKKNHGEVHRYIPDLLVTYRDGSQDLIEVKSNYFLAHGDFYKKEKAAKRHCKKNGLRFRLLTEVDIFKRKLREPLLLN